MSRYLGKRKLMWIGCGIAGLAGAGAYGALRIPDVALRNALLTSCMQVFTATVIGGFAQVVLTTYTRQKQKFDHMRDYRLGIRAALVDVYAKVEQAKTVMLAKGRSDGSGEWMLVERYDEQMERICAARHSLRAIAYQVEIGSSRAFVAERDRDDEETKEAKRRLQDSLKRMHDYVEALDREWCVVRPKVGVEETKIRMPKWLGRFLVHRDGASVFEREFEMALYVLRSPGIEELRRQVGQYAEREEREPAAVLGGDGA